MHTESLFIMRALLSKYAHNPEGRSVIDVGSYNVNGTYREIVSEMKFKSYLGIDIAAGPNVDVVVEQSGPWPLNPVDTVISGQCLEHVMRPWEWMMAVQGIMLPSALAFIIAPWKIGIHRHPVDCWRILPDGLGSLFEYSGLKLIECGVTEFDCYGVAQKP